MPDNLDPLVANLPAPLTVSTIESFGLPENADLDGVSVVLATAPVGSSAIFDVVVAGTSLFATTLGSIRKGATPQGGTAAGLTTTSTQINVDPGASGLAPKQGQVITIDTEDMLVTGATGSPLTTGGAPEYQVTVTRAVNGTAPATHAVGASILPAKPKVAAGATASAGLYVPAFVQPPEIASGAVVSLTCTQVGSTTAGGGGTLTIELGNR